MQKYFAIITVFFIFCATIAKADWLCSKPENLTASCYKVTIDDKRIITWHSEKIGNDYISASKYEELWNPGSGGCVFNADLIKSENTSIDNFKDKCFEQGGNAVQVRTGWSSFAGGFTYDKACYLGPKNWPECDHDNKKPLTGQ